MSEENTNVGNEQNGTAVPASTPASPPASQPLSADITALTKRLDSLESENKALQSGKDKRWNQVMPVIEQVAEVLGLDKAKVMEAAEKAEMKSLLQERLAQRFSGSSSLGRTEPTGSAVEVSSIVSEFGLDAKDPLVADFVTQNAGKFQTQEQAELAVAHLIKQKAKQPNPTLAQSAAPVTGNAVTPSGEQLVGEYGQKLLALRGRKDAILALKEEYRKKGVPVDNVKFSV